MTKPAIHIIGDDQEDGVRLTILREKRPYWSATLGFGRDRHYNISITVDPSMADSHAADKIERPLAHVQIGGLDDSAPEQEITVYRAFGEDDLRWLAKAVLAAAGECRRIESQRRKKALRLRDQQHEGRGKRPPPTSPRSSPFSQPAPVSNKKGTEMTVTIESMCNRWMSSDRPLFKGDLISDDGCCCAQGDVLRCSGYTDDQLRAMTQENADAEVAKLLGISRAQSVLLRMENDKKDGCPQDVLLNPAKILGDEWPEIDRFWRHLDSKTPEEWNKIADAALDAEWTAAWAAARTAAWDAARDAAWDAARDAALDAEWTAAWAAANATSEIQGRRTLKSPYFCKLFGFKTTHGDGYTKSGSPE